VGETFSAVIRIVDAADSTIRTASEFPFRIGFGIDTKIGTVPAGFENSFAVAPQENLLIGVNTQVNVLGDMFKLGVEGVAGAYTKDLTSDEVNIDSAGIPAFVKSFYKPRISTNVDYAVASFLHFNAGRVSARAGYRFTGPGYNSLGLSYVVNDQQEITGMTSVNLSPVTVFVNYGRVNDNVIKQKLLTTVRNQYGASLSAFASSKWNTSAMVNFLDMGNDSPNDTTRTDFTNMMLSLNNMFTFGEASVVNNLSVNYSFQHALNRSFMMKNNTSSANSVNLSVGFEPVARLSSSLSLGFVHSVMMDTVKTLTQNYTVTTGYPLFDAKMQNMLSVTASVQDGNTAFNFLLSSSFAITQADILSFQVGANTFTASDSFVRNYREVRTSLNVAHRF